METQPPAAYPAPQAPVETLPNVPSTWPGAWGIYKYSKQAIRRNWTDLILLYVIDIVIGAVLGFIPIKVLGPIITYLADFAIEIAMIAILLASVRGYELSATDALKKLTSSLYLRYLGGMILLGIAVALSMLVFIVPFFFVFPRLILTPYYLVDKNLGPVEALQASWEASKGNVGKIWGIIGATIAMFLLMLTIIGIPFSIYFLFMYAAAFVVLYEFINVSHPAAVAVPVADAPVATPPAPTIPVAPQQ